MSVQSEITRLTEGVAAAYAAAYEKGAQEPSAEKLDSLAETISSIPAGAQVASGTVVLPGSRTSFTITPGFKVKKLCIGTSDADGSGLYVNGTIDTTDETGIHSVSSTEAKTTVAFTSYLNRARVNIWWMAST